MATIPLTLIFGAGRAGLALASAIGLAGGQARVVARSPAGEARIRARGLDHGTAQDAAALWILAVPDDVLPRLSSVLATELRSPLPAVALHLSGGAALDALEPLSALGVSTGWMHPLQTLTFSSPSDALQGVPAAVGGSGAAAAAAYALATTIGMQPFAVSDADRPKYHAAATLASGFAVALMDVAIQAAVDAGVPPVLARNGIARLTATAAERVGAEGTAEALTGPIRRGDVGTVVRHLDALDATLPAHGLIYRVMAARTLALAQKSGMPPETVAAMQQALAPRAR